MPRPVAQTITGDVITSFQRYFAGVTIVAAFNGIVVGLAALLLGVPLAGTIAVVTFFCAYIPYIGAFFAGAFAVMIALGSEGTTTALIMLVVVILANGALQQIVQPIAYGATLGLHPLVVLIVTISAGALFGMVGLVLAAPLTSAGVHIAADLARAKAAAAKKAHEEQGSPGPSRSLRPDRVASMTAQAAAEKPSLCRRSTSRRGRRRIVKVAVWLAGIAVVLIVARPRRRRRHRLAPGPLEADQGRPAGLHDRGARLPDRPDRLRGVSYYGILGAAYPGEVTLAADRHGVRRRRGR